MDLSLRTGPDIIVQPYGLYSGAINMYQVMNRVRVTAVARAHPYDYDRLPELHGQWDLPLPEFATTADLFVAVLQEIVSDLSAS